MKRKISYLLVVIFLCLSPAAALAKSAPGDLIDIKSHWAEQDIQSCCNLGIMSGVGVNVQGHKIFAPDSQISRAQLAVVLQRTFQLDYGKTRFIKQPLASDYYWDVNDHSWYSEALVMCAINNVLDSGCNLQPDGAVSRIELARAVYRAFNAKNINLPMNRMMPVFADTQKLNQEDMNALIFVNNTGLMTGSGGYFHPNDAVKRGELASVLNRCARAITIDENYNGKEYNMGVGQSITLSLASNPTTGYTWNLSDSYDKNIVSLGGEAFSSPVQSPRIGQGGRQYYTFKALKPGQTEINLIYARPWESVQPLQKFNLKIVVGENQDDQSVLVKVNKVTKSSDLINIDLNIPQISGIKNEKVQTSISRNQNRTTSLFASMNC